jgi:hypothetical protein
MADEQFRCVDHTEMAQAVGRIEGKLDTALENQDGFREAIDTLTANGVRERADIIQIRKPIQWATRIALGTLGAIGLLVVQSVFPKFIKWVAGAL